MNSGDPLKEFVYPDLPPLDIPGRANYHWDRWNFFETEALQKAIMNSQDSIEYYINPPAKPKVV